MTREYQVFLTYTLIGFCLLSALVYGINLYSVITHTVALQKAEKQIIGIESSVQSLDAKYISLSSKITREMAKDYGLRETEVSVYINRDILLGSAVLRASDL
ncbi:MAG: hypothetical protein AAB629_01035 [Patescibacteria group bacterium]